MARLTYAHHEALRFLACCALLGALAGATVAHLTRPREGTP